MLAALSLRSARVHPVFLHSPSLPPAPPVTPSLLDKLTQWEFVEVNPVCLSVCPSVYLPVSMVNSVFSPHNTPWCPCSLRLTKPPDAVAYSGHLGLNTQTVHTNVQHGIRPTPFDRAGGAAAKSQSDHWWGNSFFFFLDNRNSFLNSRLL